MFLASGKPKGILLLGVELPIAAPLVRGTNRVKRRSAAISGACHITAATGTQVNSPKIAKSSAFNVSNEVEVFREHGKKSRWELVDLTHKLPEWKDPQGGAIPITARDMLKAGGKTELEIAAIEDELEGVALAEAIFGAR